MSTILPPIDEEELFQYISSDKVLCFSPGEYTCDDNAKDAYSAAIQAVTKLFLQGKCFVEIDDPEKPYQYHTIYIHWLLNDDYMIELETKTVIESLTDMNLSIIDDGTWQLGKEIYHRIS